MYLVRAALTVALAVALSSLAPVPASAAKPDVMKMGTVSINDQQHEWLKMYQAVVEKDTHGRVQVQVYPASQLGSIPREIEDVQFGAIQGWVGPPEFLTGVDPRFEVIGIPGTFHSDAQLIKTVQDPRFAKVFLNLGADKGLLGISLFLNGQQSLIARKPMPRLADASGLKIRITAGPVLEVMTHAIGATPIPMPFDQVLPALQQGAIDGVITTLAVVTPQKYYTVAPYAVPFPGYVGDISVISTKWLATLPPDLRKIVVADGLKVGREIVPFIGQYLRKQSAIWTANGGEIVPFPATDERRLEAAVAPIGHQVTSAHPAIDAVYQLLLTTAAKYR